MRLCVPPILALMLVPRIALGQTTGSILPESGAKSPFSPLAVPTSLKPQQKSLEQFLDAGYRILATTLSGPDQIFVMNHRDRTVLCALTPPDLRNGRNVPTSRCWALNKADQAD
ncbi:hypothetical protein [Swaminathania salitolerans]|uniref:Uncharacterized protein n=1 Tax=Swaminathania salitolerans TaxID=182838 RepID=A0A511BPC6_9PROT|nr:hypothetical protein [Swaminathania salitolerans]GBQ10831.1 hypothetical protein AA21291_0578 [Swaminathania salitolerans LMG 21291]GEL02186.1 hypothetical protein SSA02_13490 [Swaminathania salitolerans]